MMKIARQLSPYGRQSTSLPDDITSLNQSNDLDVSRKSFRHFLIVVYVVVDCLTFVKHL